MVKYDLHVSRFSRNKYGISTTFFSLLGKLIIADFRTARIVADNINKVRKAENKTNLITAGQLNAVGLLHEIYHLIIRNYEEKENPGVLERTLGYLENSLNTEILNKVFKRFLEEFPPLQVYNKEITAEEFISGTTDGVANRKILLEEIILLHFENINPAAKVFDDLFSDKVLKDTTGYKKVIEQTEKFFETEKPVAEKHSLFSFLKIPITSNPGSLEEQLDFIKSNWVFLLGEDVIEKILKGKGLIIEDGKLFSVHGFGEKPSPPVPTFEFDKEYFEYLKRKHAEGQKLSTDESQYLYAETEQFTEDTDWMPKVVVLAKNAFVWLYQLSKKYGRTIKRLDEIPDEELDQLARWNYTGLWLIGLWERSNASKKIKQIMGNPEAASSAYSLYDYVIANELGGEEAFQNLKDRAWKRGIRMASDMVPNHTGMFSKWVVEKPDYFIQSSHPPYPGYSFTGADLSDDDRVEVKLEDKYYTRSDAAVVFQRRDKYTGDTRYIYHGNDGTIMPWNDTAQLNLLNPEVREALIQIILHVARKTPIIRFDAAMVLAKKHYQRLWFPQPGTPGAVPSRADHSMSRAQFDEQMPVEFWREVVDRINAEMPNTLLLAEAFWLMEGYFVRTLGMHRVYNSAFMHMLMKEENDQYRTLIKNTLEFNPEILKRYVNFMSNPDEETAVNQFGKGDKYFGIAMMMVTLPGLPMFAHGQIEGYSEKYGMEYQKSYYDEYPDEHLVKRHEDEIFPLMKKRYLFSQVRNFELYDFCDDSGNVIENVFAYSNAEGNEKALVVYNNSYYECRGTIRNAVYKFVNADNQHRMISFTEALGIKNEGNVFYVYKDLRTKMEYLVPGSELHENGLPLFLQGYKYFIFSEFQEIYDHSGEYQQLYNVIGRKPVPSIEFAKKELYLNPLHNSFRELFTYDIIHGSYLCKNNGKEIDHKRCEKFEDRIEGLIRTINRYNYLQINEKEVFENIKCNLKQLKLYYEIFEEVKNNKRKAKTYNELNKEFEPVFENRYETYVLFVFYIILKNSFEKNKNSFMDFLLDNILFEVFEKTGYKYENIYTSILLLKVFLETGVEICDDKKALKDSFKFFNELIENEDTRRFINVNEYEGVKYFNKERFEVLMSSKVIIFGYDEFTCGKNTPVNFFKKVKSFVQFSEEIKLKAEKSGYEVGKFPETKAKAKKPAVKSKKRMSVVKKIKP